MNKARQKHSPKFKAQVALEAIREQDTLADIARRHKVNANLVHKWKREALERMAEVFEAGRPNTSDSGGEKETELLRKIGQLTLENDFLARGLARVR